MTPDDEACLWQAEMTANRARYSKWLKQRGASRPQVPDTPAIARSKQLIREAREIVAVAKALRSRNR